jgi:trehalose-6-phosphate synthase
MEGSKLDMAALDVLGTELSLLQDLIETEQDPQAKEEMKQERMQLVARVNKALGTEHIMAKSRISTINNDLSNTI